jgi:hypothetical protein
MFLLIVHFIYLAPVLIAQQNPKVERYFQNNDQSPVTENIIIDSDYTLDEALKGSTIPHSIKSRLELVTVMYYGFDNRLHQGQIIVHRKVVDDVREIFKLLEETKFPVEKVIPIVKYNWSDEKSMEDNNSASFNYRVVSGSKILSMHANGLAIDINPMQNPYVKNGDINPAGSSYNLKAKGTIEPDSKIVKAFKERGWIWGGNWKSLKDYQHFQKKLK